MNVSRLILNLGCGSKTCESEDVVNIDWSIQLRIRTNPVLRVVAPILMKGGRLERFRRLPKNILVHNLSKGLPYASNAVDVVYHSHVLEHLDVWVARRFILEIKRVLKPGGIHRIVVPDFEALCRSYLQHVEACDRNELEISRHEAFIDVIIEQMVRREASGTSKQSRIRRFLENLVLGDARRRGETHQWMYDRFSLSALLLDAGFSAPTVMSFSESQVEKWPDYSLDVDEEGQEYKPNSLYMEARK